MLNKTLAAAVAVAVGAASLTSTAEARRWYPHGGGDWHHHGGNNWHYNNGNAWAAGAVGFGAGALLGSALASPRYYEPAPTYYQSAPYAYYQPAPVYVEPPAVVSYRAAAWSPEWYSYCQSRYRSFNPSTGYFLGYDGQYHFCN